MRILWIQPLSYERAQTGAARANRVLVEELIQRGHMCDVMALDDKYGGWPVTGPADTGAVRDANAVGTGELLVCSGLAPLLRALPEVLARRYDWVVVSEDATFVILSTVLRHHGGRICYLAHGPSVLPFGPFRFVVDESGADLLASVDLVVTVSRWMRSYLAQWAGVEAELIDLPVYGPGPFADLGRFDSGHVTLINASPIKGLPIFLELARVMPDVAFMAHTGWATGRADLEALDRLPNTTVVRAVADIETLYEQTRVLLVPSLSPEGLGLVAVEAMLRGIPVIASDQGGLPEAKLGVDHTLPVQPIAGYDHRSLDERRNPRPILRPIGALDRWRVALSELVHDRAVYERLGAESRRVANAFVRNLRPGVLEDRLAG